MSDKIEPQFKKLYVSRKNNLKEILGITNDMAVPMVSKVVLNIGVGGKGDVKKAIERLEIISGQKAITRKARISVAQFGIREKMEIGAMVTCRGDKMYFLLQRIHIALLNFRSFLGFNVKSITVNKGIACFSFGVRDATIFHGVHALIDNQTTSGLDITICMKNCSSKKHAIELLKGLDFPFRSN